VTRQTWTAFVSAALFVGLSVLLAVMPVPFVSWSPGGTENTLGAVKGQPIISIDGIATYRTTGELDLTIVSGTAANSRLTLLEALASFWLPNRDTLPRDTVFPPGRTADEVERAETEMMDSSQSDAVVAALRAAGQPVTEMPAVSSVTVGGPAHRRLLPGDLIEAVDGVSTPDTESVVRQIRTHRPRDVVRFTVLRAKERKQISVTAVESSTQLGTAVVGITVGRGFSYAPTIRFDLGQQLGGPSAGLVFALAIYDKVTPGDLLRELHVAGTGQIAPDGRVGAIGGVRQKVAAAADAGATVFLVPAVNCPDLVGVDPDLRMVRVATLTEAIEAVGAVAQSGENAVTPSCP
jgi:Lon-like protease